MSNPTHYSENPDLFPLEGGCSCGLIRYSINAAPLCVHCCHCTACQREQGTAFAINILIEAPLFRLLPPTPRPTLPFSPAEPASPSPPAASFPAGSALASSPNINPSPRPGPNGVRGFYLPALGFTPTQSGDPHHVARCPRCRNAVYGEYGGETGAAAIKFVMGGTLDRAWALEPDVHLYTRSKRAFFRIDDGKPQFDSFYDRRLVWRPDALARLEAFRSAVAAGSAGAATPASPSK